MAFELEYPWEGCKGYIVFHKKEQRNMLIVIRGDGTRTTTPYARYLMSVKVGRLLTKDEQVDHIDEDKTNDDIDNLQILSNYDNVQKHFDIKNKRSVMIELTCPVCNTTFKRSPQRVNFKLKQGKKPTCSRTCGYVWGKRTLSNRSK